MVRSRTTEPRNGPGRGRSDQGALGSVVAWGLADLVARRLWQMAVVDVCLAIVTPVAAAIALSRE